MKIKIKLFLIVFVFLGFFVSLNKINAESNWVSVRFQIQSSELNEDGNYVGTYTIEETTLSYDEIASAAETIRDIYYIHDGDEYGVYFTPYVGVNYMSIGTVGFSKDMTYIVDEDHEYGFNSSFAVSFSIDKNSIVSDNLSPVIGGETNYITDVNNPVSLAIIKSGLSAVDNIDGNIPSSSFVLVSDGYSANSSILGTYDVKYKVSDNAGNEAFVTVTVHVVDVSKPVVTVNKALNVTLHNKHTFESYLNLMATEQPALQPLLPHLNESTKLVFYSYLINLNNLLSVTDNYDGNTFRTKQMLGQQVLDLNITTDTFWGQNIEHGAYYIKGTYSDSSGNESDEITITINFIDDGRAPKFSGPNNHYIRYNNQETTEFFKSKLTVFDDYDGEIPLSDVSVKNDAYTSNYNTKGTYQITYTVSDSSGNSTDYTVTVNVIDDIRPTISGKNAYTTGSKVKLLESDIKSALTAVDDYDGTLNIMLVKDNYTENYNVIGTHTIKYMTVDSSYNETEYIVTITVLDDIPPVIYTNDAFINIDGALNLTLEQIIAHLIKVGNLESSVNLENYVVYETDYNSKVPGEYEVVLMRSESASSNLKERISIGIVVMEENEVPEPTTDDTINDEPKDDKTFEEKLKEFWNTYGVYIVVGILGLVVVLLLVKAINPSNRKRR